MGSYIYRAVYEDVYKYGCLSAKNKHKAIQRLEKKEYTDIEVFKTEVKYTKIIYTLVNRKELSILNKQLYSLYKKTNNFEDTVLKLSEQTSNKWLKIIFVEAYDLLNEGFTIVEIFDMYEQVFPRYMVKLTYICYDNNNLLDAFYDLGEFYQKISVYNNRMRRAFSYPLLISCVLFTSIFLVISFVIPLFVDILLSMGIKDISTFFDDILIVNTKFYMVFLIIVATTILTIIAMLSFSNRSKKYVDVLKIKIPIVKNIYKKIAVYKIIKTVDMLILYGYSMSDAFIMSFSIVDNLYIRKELESASLNIVKGQPIDHILEETGLFNGTQLDLIRLFIIDEKFNMEKDFIKPIDAELDEDINKFLVYSEPILILLLAILATYTLISVAVPMIKVLNSLI